VDIPVFPSELVIDQMIILQESDWQNRVEHTLGFFGCNTAPHASLAQAEEPVVSKIVKNPESMHVTDLPLPPNRAFSVRTRWHLDCLLVGMPMAPSVA
jgi:hypothetical protein